MEKLLQALNDSGFIVHTLPGKHANGQCVDEAGCSVTIMTTQYMVISVRTERWDGYGATVRDALNAACFQLQKQMRPAYQGYLVLAEAFEWDI